jgi:hypothetical protein
VTDEEQASFEPERAALAPHTIGLEEVDDGIWSIYCCDVLLARLDERDSIIRS